MAGHHDSSHGVSRVVHHKDYYLRGGDMTVLVENHLYRIHSYFFARESLFFRQKFNSAHNNGEQELGSNDHNAYTLEDVKSEDFARLLWVFYNPKYSIYEAPLETWLSILKLANRWTFDSVKELSVRELEKIEIEPVEKIAIYHDNTISRLYLIPSYIAVCKRDKSLTFSEGMKLGMETVLRIAEARERLRHQASESGIRTPTFEDFEDVEVEVLIREIFNLGGRAVSPNSATSPVHGINGTPTIKLNPAPPGNPPKANGAHAPRANGGSAADPRGASVDALPSFTTVMSPSSQQSDTTTEPAPMAAPPMVTPPIVPPTATPPTATTAMATPSTATQEPHPPVPPAKPAQVPTPSPLTTGKGKDPKEDSRDLGYRLSGLMSPKSGGAGEPSSSGGATSAGSHDVLISGPVVQPSDPNDNVTEPNENVHDAENEQSNKDNDNASVFSENESSARVGKQAGGRNKRSGKAARGARR